MLLFVGNQVVIAADHNDAMTRTWNRPQTTGGKIEFPWIGTQLKQKTGINLAKKEDEKRYKLYILQDIN